MNRFLCFVGLLAVMTSASLIVVYAQANGSEKMNDVVLDNASSNNASTSNLSANNFTNNLPTGLVADDLKLTMPDLSKPMSNVSINATAGPSQPVFAVLGPAFTIGTGMKNNSSAYRLGGKAQITKNLSTMWYIVQATPHGYV